jgi:GntR family transcriptional regulator, transcriptional repressor for pyruvate dehydrogenase complex
VDGSVKSRGDQAQESIQIGRVLVPKASDLLAARIREQVLSGIISEGQALPTERDLVAETGLGRGTIREALRILENQGFIVTRTGRNGGSVVRRPGRASVEDSIGIFIRGQQLRLAALLEAREALEPAAARLAASHRTDGDLAKLSELQAQLSRAVHCKDVPAYLLANVNWHLAVVHASGNELLITFMTAIAQAVHAATEADNFNSDAVREATLRAHERIMDAIVACDPDAAERRMRRHVQAYVALVGPGTAVAPDKAKRKGRSK